MTKRKVIAFANQKGGDTKTSNPLKTGNTTREALRIAILILFVGS